MIEWIVTSSILTLTILGLRFLLKGKISLRLQYGLWILVLLRLLIPISIDSRLSIMNLLPEPTLPELSVSFTENQQPNFTVPDSSPALVNPQQQPQQSQAPQVQTNDGANAQTEAPVKAGNVLLWLWLAGMALTAGILLCTNLHFAARLRRSRHATSMKNCPLPVYITGCVATPCLYGPFLPKIYLPADFNEQCLDHVLIHELTHWRHKDHIWSLLRCVCLVLHWYNPLIWVAAGLSRQDGELACDEAVLKKLGDTQRIAYGKTLIEMSCINKKPSGLFLAATTMMTTKKSLKERIIMIARKPKTALFTLVCVLLIAIVAVGCTFTGASESTPPVTKAAHFEETNALYVYEKDGFGSDFFIKINPDGSYTYSEGALSSYFGLGSWTLDNDILALTDKVSANIPLYNEFRMEEDALVWLAENSTGFTYMKDSLQDGARFLYRGSKESPKPYIQYVEDITDVAKGLFDGGLRATFVNVNGTVFVWNHYAVDSLDGLAVAQVGTVIENDITKLPETHLAACRIPVGTPIYLGKDAENSQYPAVYCKVNDKPYYARLLPEAAFHTDDRWWENATIYDSANTLTLEKLSQIGKEKKALLSQADLTGYTHLEVIDNNYLVYCLYDLENGYRFMLTCANTQTPVEALYTRLYHKDTPENYIDIRTDDIDTFINRNNSLNAPLIVVDNHTGRTYTTSVYPIAQKQVPLWLQCAVGNLFD